MQNHILTKIRFDHVEHGTLLSFTDINMFNQLKLYHDTEFENHTISTGDKITVEGEMYFVKEVFTIIHRELLGANTTKGVSSVALGERSAYNLEIVYYLTEVSITHE